MDKLFKYQGHQSQTVESKKIGHKKQILRAIYFKGPLSNSELSGIVRLSTPKTNSLLLELMEDGLVKDLGRGTSSGGRRPSIYGLVENGFYVAGISINIHDTVISVFNSNNEEVSGPHHFSVKMKPELSIFSKVNEKFEEIISAGKIPREKILVAGIELPGLINLKKGLNKTYFPDVENLAGELKTIFGLPVFFNHDAKVRTFVEQHFGLAKNRKHVLYLQADWGLGLGIIINGKLYTGHSGYSGEFGHVPMVDNGPLCSCGKQGCLETMVSATSLEQKAREGVKNGKSILMKELVHEQPENIEFSTVLKAANAGDQFAISLFAEAGHWLGRGIAYLIQIFNPELIIIGGCLAEAEHFLMAPVQLSVQIYSNSDISSNAEIRFSKLGAKAGTMGVAAYALERLSILN